jgi:hypothetical protein
MTAFEYVSVFISVILGLGITQALTGIADLIHQSKRVRIFWPHLVWIALVIIMHVQEWWVTFDLRSLPSWRLPTFLFVMLYPITLFILARLLFPFGLQDEVIDLKGFYFENYRRIFLFSALLALLATLDSLFIRHDSLTDQIPKVIIMVMLSAISWTKTVNPVIHKIIALLLALFLVISIVLAWDLWLVANE